MVGKKFLPRIKSTAQHDINTSAIRIRVYATSLSLPKLRFPNSWLTRMVAADASPEVVI